MLNCFILKDKWKKACDFWADPTFGEEKRRSTYYATLVASILLVPQAALAACIMYDFPQKVADITIDAAIHEVEQIYDEVIDEELPKIVEKSFDCEMRVRGYSQEPDNPALECR